MPRVPSECAGRMACVPALQASEQVFALALAPFTGSAKRRSGRDRKTGEVTTCDKRNGYRFSVTAGTIFEDTKVALNFGSRLDT